MGEPTTEVLFILAILMVLLPLIGIAAILYHVRKSTQRLEHRNQERNRKIEKQLEIIEKTFIAEIQDVYAKQEKFITDAKNKERTLFDTFIKLRDATKENCMNAMTNTGACRIAVYLLHNGSSSTHGVKFFKMSCICEKVAIGSGIREQSVEHSNIPINLFDTMLDKLIENGRYIIMNDDDIVNSNQRVFVSGSKIKYSQAVSIFDYSNNILGFVLAEMDHGYDREQALKEKEEIDIFVNQLVPILSFSEYMNTAIEQQQKEAQHE